MKGFSRLFLVVMVATAMLLSACGASAAGQPSAGGSKPLASLVEVSGYIEAISGNQWTINGQVVTIDPVMLNDNELSNYQVGDYIEIKAEVSTDGSLVAREVDSSDDGNANDDDNANNSNDDDSNSNDDSNHNDDASNDNDDDSNGNDNDDSNDNSNGNDDSNDNNDDSNSNDDDGNDDDDNENDD